MASIGDAIPTYWRAHQNAKQVAMTLRDAGWPLDDIEEDLKLLYDCETLRMYDGTGGQERQLAALLTPEGVEMWRRRNDREKGQTHIEVPNPRTLFRVGWMLDEIVEGLEGGVETAIRIEEKFALVIRAVCEIEAAKQLAAEQRAERRRARDEGRALPTADDPAAEAERVQRAIRERAAAAAAELLRGVERDNALRAMAQQRRARADPQRDVEEAMLREIGGEIVPRDDADAPEEDLLANIEDEPLDLREAVQRRILPELTERDRERAKLLRSADHMRQTAEVVLKQFVEDLNERFEVIDDEEEHPRHLDFETVKRAFGAWLTQAHPAPLVEAMQRPLLRELWDCWAATYRYGLEQLSAVAMRLLAVPASEAHQERNNKVLREVYRPAGHALGPAQERARMLFASCPSLTA